MMMPLFAVVALIAQAPTLHVPALFSDGMVLQRNEPIPFYGKAAPGTPIQISLNNHHAATTTRRDGTWSLKLRPMDAGGPFTATITGDGTLSIHNVLIGDVWVCSGQSNMELRVNQANDSDAAQVQADPAIRMFTVQHLSAETPPSDVSGTWTTASPESVLDFSAVGYWYAVELHKALNIPIGMIHASWGGTPAEAWTQRRAMRDDPDLEPIVRTYLKGLSDFPTRKALFDRDLNDWKNRVYHPDTGNDGFGLGYAYPDRDTSSWKKVTLPNLLEVTEERDMDGAVWYRKEIELQPYWAGKDLRLELGPISDFDITYFNGIRIGSVDEHHPFSYAVDRVYPVPPGLVKAGRNVIAVRVFNQYGRGGFTGGATKLKIYPRDGSESPISLAGDWLSKIERYIEPAPPEVVQSQPQPPYGPGHPWAPGGLFNGMIAPLIPYQIKGVIWYQGESNADRAFQYRELFPALISTWRKQWGEGDFPFYFVQLPNYTQRVDLPGESNWAELREAQAMALRLPNTAMATTIDIGEANDIHPKNKAEVARRLALLARDRIYGDHVPALGPTFKELRLDGDTAKIVFDHVEGGLKSSDGSAIGGFTLAGEDRKFYWGTAKIVGNSIELTCPYVPKPMAVRYAWANNPYVNLVNSEGLPTTPFRTDDWPGITIANSVGAKK